MKFMKFMLFVLLALVLVGCVAFPAAKYDYISYDPETGNPIKEFHVASRREMKDFKADYDADTGELVVTVADVTSQPSPLEQIFASMLPAILERMYGAGQASGALEAYMNDDDR